MFPTDTSGSAYHDTGQPVIDGTSEHTPLQSIDSELDDSYPNHAPSMCQIRYPKYFQYFIKYMDTICIIVMAIQIILQHFMIHVLFNVENLDFGIGGVPFNAVMWLITTILFHCFMAVILIQEFEDEGAIRCNCFRCILLSPIAPIILYYVRRYHFDPVLNQRLASLNLKHSDPYHTEEYENRESMNLYRWMQIQSYRQKPYLWYTAWLSLVWCVQARIIFRTDIIYYRLICFLMGTSLILSVFLQAMVYRWPTLFPYKNGKVSSIRYRKCVFIQSYWFNVCISGLLKLRLNLRLPKFLTLSIAQRMMSYSC